MSRRNRRRKGGGPSDGVTGALLTVLGIVLIAALAGLAWWVNKTKIPLGADNCPLNQDPRAVHVVIFDRSDPISGQQAQRIRQEMEKLKKAASFAYRFDIYTFEGDSKNELQPILKVCSPGRPEEANDLIENPDMIRRDFEEKFAKALDETVEFLLKESERPTSPIIESLKAATITSFGRLEGLKKIPLRVTLFSDMIQHSSLHSQIRFKSDFAKLSKEQVWPTLRPDLKGAQVEMFYLLRPGQKGPDGRPVQSSGHQRFWEDLVAAGNGRLTSVEPL